MEENQPELYECSDPILFNMYMYEHKATMKKYGSVVFYYLDEFIVGLHIQTRGGKYILFLGLD